MSRALLAALLLAATACNQSLFDSSTAGDDDGAGVDAGSACPTPCLGDAVDDFNPAPTPADKFRYRDDDRALYAAYADMTRGDWKGADAFVGTGPTPPAIASCPELAGFAQCAGVADRLLLVPGVAADGNHDAALVWISPLSGKIRLSGSYRSADGMTGMQQRITVRRNARPDVLYQKDYLPGPAAVEFDFEADVRSGDRVILNVGPPASGNPVPVGFKLYVSDLAEPATCLLAYTFDDEPPKDVCSGRAAQEMDYNDATDIAKDLAQPASFDAEFGKSLSITHDAVAGIPHDYLKDSGGGLDFSDDFTVDLWAKLSEPPAFGSVMFANWDCESQGGLIVGPNEDGTMFVGGFHAQPGIDLCFTENSADTAAFNRPIDQGWHFYRFTRNTAEDTVDICVDGVKVASMAVPGQEDMTSAESMYLGRNVVYNPPYFDGELDELRITKRTLLCE